MYGSLGTYVYPFFSPKNGISIGSVIFAGPTFLPNPQILMLPTVPGNPQKFPFLLGIWTPSNTWFLWPSRVRISNRFTICIVASAGLTVVTIIHTDHVMSGQAVVHI